MVQLKIVLMTIVCSSISWQIPDMRMRLSVRTKNEIDPSRVAKLGSARVRS